MKLHLFIHSHKLLLTACYIPCPPVSCQLEKFKFVLDFKIKELKRQIEPRETEIGSMKEHIKEMDRELEQVTPSTRWCKTITAVEEPPTPSAVHT